MSSSVAEYKTIAGWIFFVRVSIPHYTLNYDDGEVTF